MRPVVPAVAHELVLSKYAYRFDVDPTPPPGYRVLAASSTIGILVAVHESDDSHCFVVFRGTRLTSVDDIVSDVAIARGKLSFSKRAQNCREFVSAWHIPGGIRYITFTGHSLGGSLAIELLNNAFCLPRFRPYALAAIVFNPGWKKMTRHYKLADAGFFRAVTIYRINGDLVSAALLRSRFNTYGRVSTITLNKPLKPLAAHAIGSFFLTFVDLSSEDAPLIAVD